MAPAIPATEPTSLIAGDSWQWDKHLGDYSPADGWLLRYSFGAAATHPDILPDPDAGNAYWEVRQAPSYSEDFDPGSYQWAAYVEKGSGPTFERHRVDSGLFIIEPNLDAVTDHRTTDEVTLDLITAAIQELLSGKGMTSFTLNGRSVTYTDVTELVTLEGTYRSRVNTARRGGRSRRRVVQFGAPGAGL